MSDENKRLVDLESCKYICSIYIVFSPAQMRRSLGLDLCCSIYRSRSLSLGVFPASYPAATWTTYSDGTNQLPKQGWRCERGNRDGRISGYCLRFSGRWSEAWIVLCADTYLKSGDDTVSRRFPASLRRSFFSSLLQSRTQISKSWGVC